MMSLMLNAKDAHPGTRCSKANSVFKKKKKKKWDKKYTEKHSWTYVREAFYYAWLQHHGESRWLPADSTKETTEDKTCVVKGQVHT